MKLTPIISNLTDIKDCIISDIDRIIFFVSKIIHFFRMTYLWCLIIKEQDILYKEYLRMKLEHLQKRFEVQSFLETYSREEDNSSMDNDEPFNSSIKSIRESIQECKKSIRESVQKYKDMLLQISDLEDKIKRTNEKDENYKNLLIELKEMHRLAYRELSIIEYEGIEVLRLFFREMRETIRDIIDSLTNTETINYKEE